MSSSSRTTASSSPLTSIAPFSTTSTPRLQALYSDFSRQKHSNPTSYHSNIEWWRKALQGIVSNGLQQQTHEDDTPSGDRLVLHAGRELLDLVKIPKVGKPLALGAVLSELRVTKSVILLPEFLSAKVSIYNPGWLPTRIAAYVVGKPLWWALEQMGVVGEEGLLGSGSRQHHHKDTSWWGEYVLVPLVERAADAVVERQEAMMASPGDALYTMESFREAFAGIGGVEDDTALRETDAKVLLKYLQRDRGVVAVDKDVIKFIDKYASAEQHEITAVDRGILELKSAIRNLRVQVESLQSKMDECTKKASAALQQKRKPVALSYLRSRKHLEDILSKRLGSLSTLESTFATVETAAGDVAIMKTYESSTETLRAILAHPSLQRSHIDETMEALAEANADAREIDDAVRAGGDVALGVEDLVDDDEVEAEWRAMVQEAEAADKLKKEADDTGRKLAGASQVPTESPSKDSKSKSTEQLAPVVAS
ncbi:Snf7-domain-containing protein [Crassisporium funariophilum]|nr:Snf7-domain-containing protein [Crassisporium funariophilum]